MTIRDTLERCQALDEFEEVTGMHLSETELQAYKEQADAAGIGLCDYLEQGVTRIRRAQEQLERHVRGMLH